ncbi:MAG: winged helix-turn-helix transcriptional regulator [Candidatus Thermoplasmatota archaeon]|nr:winged helix-turn-helix transcriptional regulator [Candidatus Thermoplasmatota archaeon]
MEHAIWRLAVLASIGVFISSAAISMNVRADQELLMEPNDIGVEVLLNDPGFSFNISALNDLLDTGEARMPDGFEPVTETENAYNTPGSDTYLLRSYSDPDLGVVVRFEDLSDMLLSMGFDNPMKGISISIFIPGEAVLTEREMTCFSLTLTNTLPEGLSFLTEVSNLGFSDAVEYSDDMFYSLSFKYNDTELYLTRVHPGGEDGSTFTTTLDINVPNGSLDGDLRSKVSSLMNLLNTTLDYWDSSEKTYQNLHHYMIKVDPAIDPALLDWQSLMREELGHLADIGLISGLNGTDILAISSRCTTGGYGTGGRLFYSYPAGEWTTYNSKELPSLLYGSFDPNKIHGQEDLPEVSVPRTDRPDPGLSAGLLIIIAAGAALLLLGSLLFQRVDRAVKLNHIRRKLIYDRISQKPGIHFSALMKDLNLKPGVASYHLNRLEKAELIKSYQDGMYRRFYLYEERIDMKVMLSDLQKIIVHTISEEPGISQMDISRMIGKSKVVINYHVRFLRDLGLLVLEREGRETHCFLTLQGVNMSKA